MNRPPTPETPSPNLRATNFQKFLAELNPDPDGANLLPWSAPAARTFAVRAGEAVQRHADALHGPKGSPKLSLWAESGARAGLQALERPTLTHVQTVLGGSVAVDPRSPALAVRYRYAQGGEWSLELVRTRHDLLALVHTGTLTEVSADDIGLTAVMDMGKPPGRARQLAADAGTFLLELSPPWRS